MDRMRALEIFVEVVEAGSLAAAARSLSVSAPSVTRVLNELEAELGVRLVHRSTRAIKLTEPGAQLLADAKRIVVDYAEATDAVKVNCVHGYVGMLVKELRRDVSNVMLPEQSGRAQAQSATRHPKGPLNRVGRLRCWTPFFT